MNDGRFYGWTIVSLALSERYDSLTQLNSVPIVPLWSVEYFLYCYLVTSAVVLTWNVVYRWHRQTQGTSAADEARSMARRAPRRAVVAGASNLLMTCPHTGDAVRPMVTHP